MNKRDTKSVLAFAVATLALLLHASRPASAQLLEPEFVVNAYTTYYQYRAAVAADGAGSFVVAWESMYQDGSPRSVFGQRFDSAGSPAGSQFQANSYTTGHQFHAAVAADPAGGFVVVWDSYNFSGDDQDLSGYGVFGQRYDSAGNRAGSEFQVNSYTTDHQKYPVVAADNAGNFVVAWQSRSQVGASDIFAQRYDSAGGKLGSEFLVNSYTVGSGALRPAVAANGAGSFVVVWDTGYQDGSTFGAFGQRYDATGARAGSEFQVNTFTTFFQWYPAVAVDDSGGFLVVWDSILQDGSSDGVFGQRFDSAGERAGSEFRVNSYTTGGQYRPAVAAGSAGDFVVTWYSLYQDGSGAGVFAQRYDADGSRRGGEFRVNSFTTYWQYLPRIAADGAGNYIVAWDSYGQDGSGTGIVGRRLIGPLFADGFDADGTVCAWSDQVGSGDICVP